MPLLRRLAIAASAGALGTLAACSGDTPTAPAKGPAPAFALAAGLTGPEVVISQVYGGGGNSGATFRNDFIELYNRGDAPVSLAGWSVQYASSSGTSWQVTPLSGSIPAGGYYLVQQAAGTGGTTSLPTPDATGTIPMSATAGKVVLAQQTTALAGSCPAGTAVIDRVGFGGTNCAVDWLGNAPTLSNTTAALRANGGCTWSGNPAADFVAPAPAPAPRNRTTVTAPCAGPGLVVASVTITPESGTVVAGETIDFTATARTADGTVVPSAVVLWATGNAAIATVTQSGRVGGVAPGTTAIVATSGSGADTVVVTVTPRPVVLPPVRLTELHYDNFGTDQDEAIEVEGPAGTDLTGWSLALYNGDATGDAALYATIPLVGIIPDQCTGRGTIVAQTPAIQNGPRDAIALVNAEGMVVEFLSYEGVTTPTVGPAAGRASADIGIAQTSAPIGSSLQRSPAGVWASGGRTFGACNGETPPPVPPFAISFSGRTPGDVPLPVGFQDQIFATLLNSGNGSSVSTTFTWSAESPATVSVDARGVITALAAGQAVVRATAENGTTATYTLPTREAVASTTAQYANHVEFGVPQDADASDDFVVTYPQFVSSWSGVRNTPNWVAYNLEATHFGPEDRCDCFTFDPALPSQFARYTTADYTGAGTIAGFGIDRGHLARSFDRTAGALDNARSFYFTNIIPQAADQNQGPWAAFESWLGDRARLDDREVFIIAGVAGNAGTVKNEGRIVIPAQTWKVAVLLPRNRGLADVQSWRDAEVKAVVMPNVPGIRNVAWPTYEVTVDSVEALSGYDLLALLRDDIEIALESNTRPPEADAGPMVTGLEGGVVAFSGAGSRDEDGDALTYAWDFGDGATGSGRDVSHPYPQDGTYTVRLIVTDPRGLADTAFTSAMIGNVAPALAPLPDALLFRGETYRADGSFTDPGADAWRATADFGDGSGPRSLSLDGTRFSLAHVYDTPGGFTVRVRVSDDDVTSEAVATVTVLSARQGGDEARRLVDALAQAAGFNRGQRQSLSAKLEAALRSLDRGDATPARNQLRALLNELDAIVQSGRASEAQVAALRTWVQRMIAAA
jgi:DNA/RNA endonuclease G (NUC1)